MAPGISQILGEDANGVVWLEKNYGIPPIFVRIENLTILRELIKDISTHKSIKKGGDLDMLNLYQKIEKCSTLDELAKLASLDELKKAYRTYMKSKEYHAKHNAKNAEMIRIYKLEHPESK